MRRQRTIGAAVFLCVALTASCRGIWGIDDFGASDGTSDAAATDGNTGSQDGTVVRDATAANDSTVGDSASETSTDGGTFAASDACAGCLVVAEMDVASEFVSVFLALSDLRICWTDGTTTVHCRARNGSPTVDYGYEAGPPFIPIGLFAIGDHSAAGVSGTLLVSFPFSGATATGTPLTSANVYGIAALPNDEVVLPLVNDLGTDASAPIFGVATAPPTVLAPQVLGLASAGNAAGIPGQSSFYVGGVGTKSLQQCTLDAGNFHCANPVAVASDVFGLTATHDGSVAYTLGASNELFAGGKVLTADSGVNFPSAIALSRGTVFFGQSDNDAGSIIASWAPGASSFNVIASLPVKPYSVSIVADDQAVFFVTYVGLHATIVAMPR